MLIVAASAIITLINILLIYLFMVIRRVFGFIVGFLAVFAFTYFWVSYDPSISKQINMYFNDKT